MNTNYYTKKHTEKLDSRLRGNDKEAKEAKEKKEMNGCKVF